MADKVIHKMKAPHVTKKGLMKAFKDNNIRLTIRLKKALRQAEVTHKKQRRDDGSSYLEQHIYPIAVDMIRYYNAKFPEKDIPQELLIGALLHDILEDDTKVNDEAFMKEYGRDVYNIVKSLTKPWHSQKVSQQEMIRINKRFFDSIINSNPYSILIKLADRTNNTESSCSSSEHGSAKSKRYVREVELEYLPYAKKHNKYFYNRLRKIIAESRKKS